MPDDPPGDPAGLGSSVGSVTISGPGEGLTTTAPVTFVPVLVPVGCGTAVVVAVSPTGAAGEV